VLSVNLYAQYYYTISKPSFIAQCNGSFFNKKILCNTPDSVKVFVNPNNLAILLVHLNNNKILRLRLSTVSCNDSVVMGLHSLFKGLEGGMKKINWRDVDYFQFQKTSEVESPFFDTDSCTNICKQLNDSLLNTHDSIYLIYLINKGDSTALIKEACYNITFTDNTTTNVGVIKNITKDSIYISNSYNEKTALAEKITFKILNYAIKDIKIISSIKRNNWGYNNTNISDMKVVVVKEQNLATYMPCYFRLNYQTGKIKFYRIWLGLNSFRAISEENGKLYWDER
jgi:hypothetical protein